MAAFVSNGPINVDTGLAMIEVGATHPAVVVGDCLAVNSGAAFKDADRGPSA